ncbi:MAG: GNAT family N-acetyltransferase [Alphaproteobacteria bacterium]|nr:GNAT family N-acetyltransferase [Alphaproteobacteria bacterium]
MRQSLTYVREYHRYDRPQIRRMLYFLPDLYPGAAEWLENRLEDVDRERAYCSVVSQGGWVRGVLLETPKGRRRSKISTLFIEPQMVGLGLGAKLIERHRKRWLQYELESITITVPKSRIRHTGLFLVKHGFRHETLLFDHYGHGRDEAIYSLTLN